MNEPIPTQTDEDTFNEIKQTRGTGKNRTRKNDKAAGGKKKKEREERFQKFWSLKGWKMNGRKLQDRSVNSEDKSKRPKFSEKGPENLFAQDSLAMVDDSEIKRT